MDKKTLLKRKNLIKNGQLNSPTKINYLPKQINTSYESNTNKMLKKLIQTIVEKKKSTKFSN